MDTVDIVDVDVVKEETSDWQEERETTEREPVENKPTESRQVERQSVHMLHDLDVDGLRSKWEMIQVEFVDEPRKSVEQADELVTELMDRLTRLHSERRAILDEHQGNGQVSTEDLRIALQGYRSFFNRLLEI